MKQIFLVAVQKTVDEQGWPEVAAPIGPYGEDETAALERGRAFLREAYDTEDIRTRTYSGLVVVDFVDVRALVKAEVIQAAVGIRQAAQAALDAAHGEALREDTERWLSFHGLDVDPADLDAVLEALGVNPADV
jgi:hypothetical protein